MNTIITMLEGKKTYITAGLMIVYALVGLYLKFITPADAGQIILTALGLAGLRNAIK